MQNPDQRLENAIKILATYVKSWPEQQRKPVRAFVKVIQEIISEHEMECLSYDVAIRQHIYQEGLLIKIMQAYGIDTSQALSKTVHGILSDYDFAVNHNNFKIPEKLKHELQHTG